VRSERCDALLVAAVSLAVRLAVVVWAAGRFPPTADGAFYHQIATRIAEGHGYTWLWPDGAVTYAAHYPVGYPAMVALGYAIFGPKPVVAMTLNAVIGAAAAVAAWSLLRRGSGGARLALAGGLAVGLHPVLVAYTAAVMTEGVTTSLLVVAAAVAARARDAREPRRWIVLAGVLMGVATLVRPQSLALAPVLGWLAVTGRDAGVRRAALGAAAVTAVALALCAPWTARNCVRMERCALVSVNGGWNLAIGTQTDTGGWHEITVPEACKTVFQEAAKDECFGREAMKAIAREPLSWLARAPAKLRRTFDYVGAAPWYLHTANASSFPFRAMVALGAVETFAQRLLLAAALVAVLRMPLRRTGALGRVRTAAVAVGLVACVLVPGTIGYLALALGVAALGPSALRRAPLPIPFSAAVILATAATHAVFFGAGRYGMVVVPFVTMLAFVRVPELKDPVPSAA
jgi:4-amino-4-deoxy-L-arabinose transferase-like glycosyltransferase